MSEITWDKYSLKIDGKRIFLMGGEFHYWRCPDRARWHDILTMYRIAGLNCVRIYFHWGYHNPNEKKFYFTDNRDVDYLLNLCEQLGLYVFVAPGPYICAETNAGGFPGWLLAKRDVMIRNLKRTYKSKYDPKYLEYCRNWYEEFISIILNHQITENPKGCVLAFQVENEYDKKIVIFKGLKRYIEELIEIARRFGITVPIFHNDRRDEGSWVDIVDLYGFDKYVIFAPKFPKTIPIPEWSFKKFKRRVDNVEIKVRSFGESAANSPLFIPELQGGWFNHWGIKYGFDDLYDYYGHTFQKILEHSLAAQGSTMMILYMFYGGTSWGSIPDLDVYSSYDYSACIREFGYQSSRFRHLRLFNLFINSFNESLVSTDLVDIPSIKCSEEEIYYSERIGRDGTRFIFFRNFNKNKKKDFKIQLIENLETPYIGSHELNLRDSFIAIGNHKIGVFTIVFCSLPIIIKGRYHNGWLLVCYQNGGELTLKSTNLSVKGNCRALEQGGITRVIFPSKGYFCITNKDNQNLYVIVLSLEEALTLNADFSSNELQVSWGAYSIHFENDSLFIESLENQTVLLLTMKDEITGFKRIENIPIPGLYRKVLNPKFEILPIRLNKWYSLRTNWSNNDHSEIWKEINFKNEKDPIDHHFTSGHILYKCEFEVSKLIKINIKLNIRNKTAIWLNEKFIGGHNTYSIIYLLPGAKNGPDPTFLGKKKYKLGNALKIGRNILYVLTENLGHSRIPHLVCDVRNPRGIISAKFSRRIKKKKWFITGIDVTKLEQSYNTAGLPGEKFEYHLGKGDDWIELEGDPSISPQDQIVWFKTTFDWTLDENKRMPLRIHLEGKHNVHIFLNGLYIGKYWGEYGPQHDFYVMDKVLKKKNILVLACWTTNEDLFSISVKPYKINPESGNIEERGLTFATQKFTIPLK
ncbi:MAG: beta-galactosidase [Candidatus Hodarchaeota archaeon]